MTWFNEVSEILQQYKGGSSVPAPSSSVSGDFAKVAEHAPPAAISGGLAEVFRSPSTPPFGQMVSQLFGNSNADQRAGILNHLIAAAGPAVSGGLLGSVSAALSGARPSVTPQQAQQIQPGAVGQLADAAQKNDPSVIDRAGEFYAQHPKLVQGLGAAALAMIMAHASQHG